jgi:hypothetical protein
MYKKQKPVKRLEVMINGHGVDLPIYPQDLELMKQLASCSTDKERMQVLSRTL